MREQRKHWRHVQTSAFDLGVPVCPIAIKYDKTFVDAFWNSKTKLFRALDQINVLVSVVADVWFMEPQTIRENETSIEFAERVRAMIAKKAGLKMVARDGMLKYYRPHPRERIARQNFRRKVSNYSLQSWILSSQSQQPRDESIGIIITISSNNK